MIKLDKIDQNFFSAFLNLTKGIQQIENHLFKKTNKQTTEHYIRRVSPWHFSLTPNPTPQFHWKGSSSS